MNILSTLKAEKLNAIKNHDNKALAEVNSKIFAIRDKARKEREKARAEAYEKRLQEKAEKELQGGLSC